MWWRKAPNCLHRQMLNKNTSLWNTTLPAHSSPLTLDFVSVTARQLSPLLTASWPEPKFRNWQLVGDHSKEGNLAVLESLPSLPSSCRHASLQDITGLCNAAQFRLQQQRFLLKRSLKLPQEVGRTGGNTGTWFYTCFVSASTPEKWASYCCCWDGKDVKIETTVWLS